ncbi:MAG: hypothetical protein WC829_04515 [Hyphomicrobium sp.]|jgi:hypothetical protein
MRTARRSINLMFADWANRGVNLWTIEERSQALTESDGSYTLGTDIVDVIEQMIDLTGSSPTKRYNMTRVSVSTHATRTNPNIQGRPVEVWYDRGQASVTAHVWPLPDSSGTYTLYFWVLRRMDDAGAYTNTSDMPFRFLPAFISGLAFMIAEKKRQDDPNLIARLEKRYSDDWTRAAEEDREKATLMIVPRSSSYRIAP